jgi:microcystin-dependent protein
MKKQIKKSTDVNSPKDLMLALAIAGAVASAIGYFTSAKFQKRVKENFNDLKDLLNKIDTRLEEMQKSVNRIEENTIMLIDLGREIVNRLTRIERTINQLPGAILDILILQNLDKRQEEIEKDILLCEKIGVNKFKKGIEGKERLIALEQNLDFIIINEYRPDKILLAIKYCEFLYFVVHKDMEHDRVSEKYINFIDRLKLIFDLDLYLVRIDASLNNLINLLIFNSNGYWSDYIESHNLDDVIKFKNVRILKINFINSNSTNQSDIDNLKDKIVSEFNYLLNNLETRAYIEKAIIEQVFDYYNICHERFNSTLNSKNSSNLNSFNNDELNKIKDSILTLTNDLNSFKKFNTIPSGTIVAYSGSIDYGNEQELFEKGWLICNGKEFDSNDSRFTNLFKALRYNWGGNNRGVFKIPKLDGQFLRGIADNKNLDPELLDRVNSTGQKVGPQVGSYQSDALRNHTHSVIKGFKGDANWVAGGSIDNSGFLALRGEQVHEDIIGEPTNVSRINLSTETRPKNAYVYWIIKM